MDKLLLDIKKYNEEGFLFVKEFYSKKKIKEAVNWFNEQNKSELVKTWTEQEPGVPLAVYSVVHDDKNPLSDLLRDERIYTSAGALMGKDCYLWSSKVNVKAPWCGAVEYYHQDYVYWKDRGYPSDSMLSCMIFLENHRIENAALHVMPGTHKYEFIEHDHFININGLSKRMIPPKVMDDLYLKHGLKIIDASPGDALFFHTSLIHGSGHNISPKGRMILLAQINTIGNEPNNVMRNAKKFNLLRADEEYKDAEKRFNYFKKKYEEQLASNELTFGSPIPKNEL
jgi:ectoine hydroxylase